ncbi:DUF2442 domain-containing protein [Pararhodobacter sp. SW119]|uniref:DUF2442 domain-containing protein n=1 Tax=Pararhodobacter sp. SW119 TaxID=2780075 RepID=UPI001FD7DDDB|nr:DUF2442 domain-containing protein [Pararhodobacter sp. SW119]
MSLQIPISGAALRRGQEAQANEPRAIAARYDSALNRVVVDLANGCTLAFPPALAEGLEAASPEQLSSVEIIGCGYGLHWEELNVDLSMPGLMAGIFGTRAWMARQGGRSTAAAKAAASRANGAKGRCPRKTS